MTDRVGIGWRGEIAGDLLVNLEAIDVFEVIAEDWIHAPPVEQRALRALATERPVLLHGVALGLAGSEPCDARRVDRLARLVEVVRPEAWSEHLAFVRAGGTEIGHLAAPPRTHANIEAAARNILAAARVIGSGPVLENIATLIEPPASALDEAAWTQSVLSASGAGMLLDLHNLYANAMNFGHDPRRLMHAMPLERVTQVHLSGGHWITGPRGSRHLLDDHVHDVPGPVYGLLEELAAWVPQPLTVVLERDGAYPAFDVLRAQLERARECLARGRRGTRIAA